MFREDARDDFSFDQLRTRIPQVSTICIWQQIPKQFPILTFHSWNEIYLCIFPVVIFNWTCARPDPMVQNQLCLEAQKCSNLLEQETPNQSSLSFLVLDASTRLIF